MAARTRHRNLHATRREGCRSDVIDGSAVERDHIAKLLAIIFDQFANATQIALSLFAYISGEKNRAARFELGFTHNPRDRGQGGEPSAVIGDTRPSELASFTANAHVSARRKDG